MTHVLRIPQIDLATLLAEQNAQIDLKLEVYESSTRNFLKAVAKYKNRAVATISDRRANQAGENKKVLEKTQAVEAETIQCKLKEIELVASALYTLCVQSRLTKVQTWRERRKREKTRNYLLLRSNDNWPL